MTRIRIAAGFALLALALLALPRGSSGDSSNPTWAGIWDTDFGDMTLNAGGSGGYKGYSSGTISGNVNGRVNEGTWEQSGDPPKKGTFRFTMGASGLSFTGEWEYEEGGCGAACGWNGTCVAGPCLENDDPPPSEPPPGDAYAPCTGSEARAFAAVNCKKGLPFGSKVSVKAPGEKSPVEVSPKETPATAEDLFLAIRELVLEEEKNEIIASIQLDLKQDPALGEAFRGCMVFGALLTIDEDFHITNSAESSLALLKACRRLLIKNTSGGRAGARVTADGCEAVFVPAFPRGEKVTKRKRRRAVAAARRQLAVSCTNRPGRLSVSIHARHGKKLRKIAQPRLRTFVGRRLIQGSVDEQRLGVRWRARPR